MNIINYFNLIFQGLTKLSITTKIIISIIIIAIIIISITVPIVIFGKSKSKGNNKGNVSATISITTTTTTTTQQSSSNPTNITPTDDLCWIDEYTSMSLDYINNTSTTDNPTISQLAYSGEALNTKKYKWAYDPNTINYIVLDFSMLNKTYYSGNDLEGLKKTIGGKVNYVANKIITISSATQSSVLTLKPCTEF